MAEKKLTVYQKLQKVLAYGSSNSLSSYSNTYNIHQDTPPNDVVDIAHTPEERDMKILQARQQKLMARQWYRAHQDVSNESLMNISAVRLMYRDVDLMDVSAPEISTAMDLVAEEANYVGGSGVLLNISSSSERVKGILEDLFVNRLSVNTTLLMITRSMLKYGNAFWLLHTDAQMGVMGWKELPIYEIERYENGMNCPYTYVTNGTQNPEEHDDETRFIWVGKQEATEYRNWQVAHFRLLYDSSMLPYGVSFLHKARRHFRMLSMMEDSMLIYRLDRSIERRVFKINVGAIDEADVPAYVQNIANEFKRTPIVDPMTGQIDLRKNVMSQIDDFFIPVREDGAPSPIENLSAGQNLTAMDDIKYIQNKIVTSLRVPKSFLNFEEAAGDGKNLSLLDVRFMRTVSRIQQALLLELNKIATIHLLMLGFTDDLTNFTIEMASPSSQAEMLDLENLAKKVTTAKDAVSDPGGGMPITSMTWVWRHIFKWSDKDIQQNLEEIRLETALASELQQTMQIIKRTHIYDPVDNIYGEAGAEYSGNQQGQEGDDGAGGGSGGFGGGGMYMGGDMDFGDDMDMTGDEGEMSMGDAATEDMAIGGGEPPMGNGSEDEGDMGGGVSNLGEMVTYSLKKNTMRELGKRRSRLIKESSKRQDDIMRRYLKTIRTNRDNEAQPSTSIYDKSFFINEELNDIMNKLSKVKPSNLND